MDLKIDKLYSSPLKRTIETAEIVSTASGKEIVTDNNIMEINMGEWEGISFQTFMSQDPELFKMFVQCPANVKIPGGEKIINFRNRIIEWLDKILQMSDNTVALVTHAGVINTILCYVLGQDMNSLWRFKTENSSLCEIFFNGNSARVMKINDTTHLTDDLRGLKLGAGFSKGESNA